MKGTFRLKPGSEAKRFEIGRVVVKSTSLQAIDGRAHERRVQGIEFWDYCPTMNSEIHGL
ncbi:hypothetical protein BDN67DRAFT_976051 [Paxillus ammoniavirescens]|nr:hypothetical protein BDN67DRAFT_976051 [Paxillus ammoniavirescens]